MVDETAGTSLVRIEVLVLCGLCSCDCRGNHSPHGGSPIDATSTSDAVSATPDGVSDDATTASGPLTIDVPPDTPATELHTLVRRALRGPRRTCWVVWGNYRTDMDARPVTFRIPDAGTNAGTSAWLACPAPDKADFVNNYGDERVKRRSLGSFEWGGFTYKPTPQTVDRLEGAIVVYPRSGLATEMLADMSHATNQCLFADLWVR